MKKLLHVGCGKSDIFQLKGFSSSWKETRLDIDPEVNPDITADITDLGCIQSESFDAIYSSHNIEHVFAHQVINVLNNFFRILRSDGILILTCPDLESACEKVLQQGLVNPLYDSGAGPISPIDIIYGHRASIANGNTFMAHKCGFTYDVLSQCLRESGFQYIYGGSRPNHFDLWAICFKRTTHHNEMQIIAEKYLP
jgi:predicted SAM-dependent methyltransferase